MYLSINGSIYENVSRRVMRDVREVCYRGQSLNALAQAPEGVIALRRNDGFLLAEEDAGTYERVLLLPGALVLTDRAEAPEPTDEDELTAAEALEILTGEVSE